ncbi:MAG: response regulator [Pseudomonadales bacterium]
MNHKLLLVEDHEMNREMLTRRLEKLGYKIVSASDGEQAVAMALEEQPDLILMDMSLPVVDGFEATHRIKASTLTSQIPVIALTAYVHEFDRVRALEAGCDEYETKPIDMNALIGKIERLIGKTSSSSSSPSSCSCQ